MTTAGNDEFPDELDTILGEPPTVLSQPEGQVLGPLVQLLDEHGQVLRTQRLTGRGLLVGRSADNDLVVADPVVSRQHARVDWDGHQAEITDLDSDNGTWLAAVRLPPWIRQQWLPGESIGLGACCLMLRRSVDEPGLGTLSWRPVHVDVACSALTLTPGEPTTVLVTLSNVNSIADEFQIAVHGVPDGWVRIVDRSARAHPGQTVSVLLAVDVPREPSGRSGDYTVTVEALSRADARASGAVRAHWIVQTFRAAELRLRPVRVTAQTQATFVATLQNLGNAPAWYALDVPDQDRTVRVRVQQGRIRVLPGETATVEVSALAPRRLVGFRTQRHTVRVRAVEQADTVEWCTAEAEFAHAPVFTLPGSRSDE